MRTLLTALTCLMFFATPMAAGDWEDARAASTVGNYEETFRLWKKLAEQGNADAQFNLGNMYQGGRRVPTNYTKYTYWYRKADGQDAG